MKRLVMSKFYGIIIIMIVIIVNGGLAAPARAADNELTVGRKVSSLLSMHIMVKEAQSADAGQNTMKPLGVDSESSGETTFVNRERVFLHFMQKPTAVQIKDLNTLGVTVYPDSWIPPVGNFTTGFALADMPIDKLDALTAKSYIATMDTAEQTLSPLNDQARAAMNVDPVWQGGDTGAGVTVAVLDSGIDTSNPDFPALNTSNSKDYSNYPSLDNTITNTVTGHGTHVTGSLLGRGVNSATYKGVAPGASLVFLKIGNDTTGGATNSAITYAIRDAVDIYHAKIVNLSYGSWSEYHDGSDQICQAVDYATSQGTTVFVAAGNEGNNGWHASGISTPGFTYDVTIQVTGSSSLPVSLVWYDGGAQNNLSLQYYDPSNSLLASINGGQSESTRGTELNTYQLNVPVGPGIYHIKVQDTSANNQPFQLYYLGGLSSVSFTGPDPNCTLDSPAEADSAIAVGCYVTRSSWTNYKGSSYQYNPTETIGSTASFSSRGPRVDAGAPDKPDIVAPGSATISVRDPLYPLDNSNYDPLIIDNDGIGLGPSNTGPANYFVMQGTSMASPMAAGVGALLLSKYPGFTPAQIKHTLEATANLPNIGSPYDYKWGWGLVNANAAINSNISLNSYSDFNLTTLCVDFTSYSLQHTVYLNASNCLVDKIYRITYYDGSNNEVATQTNITAQFEHMFVPGTDTAGTWHAVMSESQFSPANTYNPSWPYTILTSTFNVKTSAISPGYPDVLTKIVSNMTANSVTLNGTLVTTGSTGSAAVSFDYGLTANYGSTVSGTPGTLNSAANFSANLSGLTPGITYHYRAKADGGTNGTETGTDMTFNTNFMIIDNVGAFGGQSSLAISSSGNISIAYSVSTSQIKYGKWNGTIWQIQTVFSSGSAEFPSLALDNQGNPSIAFIDSSILKYARWDGSIWQIQTVDSASVNSEPVSLKFDSLNKPCIAYTYTSNSNLKYAHWDGISWQIQTVVTHGDAPSLYIDTNNKPHISYYDGLPMDLMYAWWNGSAWQVQTVDSTLNVGWDSSLILNGSGNPCISYYDASNYYLKFAKWDGSIWQIGIIDSAGMVGRYSSLQLNSSGNPCISYYDETNGNLKYAVWNGSIWQIVNVDTLGNVGEYTSLILDSSENRTISYFDVTNQALRVAFFLNTSISTVDHLQINTQPASSLSVDSPFNTSAIVMAYDISNNPVSGVSIVADRDPATGTGILRGTLSVTTNGSGQAIFNNLGYNKVDVFKVRFTSNSKTIISVQVGPLTPGTATQVNVETLASGTGIIVPTQNVNHGSSMTVYAITRDQYGNFVANSAGTWSLTGKTGGVADSDLVPSGDKKRAVFTGHIAGTTVIRVTSSPLVSFVSGVLRVISAIHDFDGDGITDTVVYDPTTQNWYILQSNASTMRIQQWGFSGVTPVPGDYDGDGKTDPAVYDPTTQNWYIWQSNTSTMRIQQWGFTGVTPVPGDYDGDGKTDCAVYDPTTQNWYILQSNTSTMRIQQWGFTGVTPVPGDYDGDGKTDCAVYDPTTQNWYIWQSNTSTMRIQQWGFTGVTPVPGDYDGDGKTDCAVYDSTTQNWYILQSNTSTMRIQQWGFTGVTAVPGGDYDGDGKADCVVYYPTTQTWYILQSNTSTMRIQQWGFSGVIPLP